MDTASTPPAASVTSMGQDMARGANAVIRDARGRRILPPRGYLTSATAAGLKSAVAADSRSVPLMERIGLAALFRLRNV